MFAFIYVCAPCTLLMDAELGEGLELWMFVCLQVGARNQTFVLEEPALQPLSLSFHSKDVSAFMVNPLTAHGVVVAVVAYDTAPKGSLWRFGGQSFVRVEPLVDTHPEFSSAQAHWIRWWTR